MKNLSKIILAAAMAVAGISSASAQYQYDYTLNYGPGSPYWCWQQQQDINAIGMQNAMMAAQIVQYYQQQAAAATQWMQTNPFTPMPGVTTYDGVYVTPDTASGYHTEKVACDNCDGGHIYRTVYDGGGRTHQSKITCTCCHGTGYVTRTVAND